MTNTLTRLETLLETERRALREGNLRELVSLLDEKSALTDALEREALDDPIPLQRLGRTLKDHGRLIEAAQAGVSDVLSRLKAQKQARESLNTYDRDGRGSQIGNTKTQTERRF